MYIYICNLLGQPQTRKTFQRGRLGRTSFTEGRTQHRTSYNTFRFSIKPPGAVPGVKNWSQALSTKPVFQEKLGKEQCTREA